jgi:hypothetical protein
LISRNLKDSWINKLPGINTVAIGDAISSLQVIHASLVIARNPAHGIAAADLVVTSTVRAVGWAEIITLGCVRIIEMLYYE